MVSFSQNQFCSMAVIYRPLHRASNCEISSKLIGHFIVNLQLSAAVPLTSVILKEYNIVRNLPW
jgi:hypothetical protein